MFSVQYSFSQLPKNSETGLVVFEDVVQLPGLSQEEIFGKAKSWILATLKSGDNMTEMSDDNFKKIVSTGTISIDSLRMPYLGKKYSQETLLNFKFIVFCKEGRLKYSIENFNLYFQYYNEWTETNLESIKGRKEWSKKMDTKFNGYVEERVLKAINKLIDHFNYSLNKKEEEDNW